MRQLTGTVARHVSLPASSEIPPVCAAAVIGAEAPSCETGVPGVAGTGVASGAAEAGCGALGEDADCALVEDAEPGGLYLEAAAWEVAATELEE